MQAIRDAFTPPLACAAAKIGDIEALEALKETVGHTVSHLNGVVHRARGCVHLQKIALTNNNLSKSLLVLQIALVECHLDVLVSWNSFSMLVFVQYLTQKFWCTGSKTFYFCLQRHNTVKILLFLLVPNPGSK